MALYFECRINKNVILPTAIVVKIFDPNLAVFLFFALEWLQYDSIQILLHASKMPHAEIVGRFKSCRVARAINISQHFSWEWLLNIISYTRFHDIKRPISPPLRYDAL